MDSHDLMRLLVPDNKVKDVAEFTGLTPSLLYMERRPSGKDLTSTGTRNTIDRLDLFCEWQLPRNPDLVRIVGDRYTQMYHRHVAPIGEITVHDLLRQLGVVSKECGEAMAALSGQASMKECVIEVAQARKALETALQMVMALEEEK